MSTARILNSRLETGSVKQCDSIPNDKPAKKHCSLIAKFCLILLAIMVLLSMFLFQQMQWSSLTPILVLPLALEQCTWMKFSALAERLTSLTALRALVSAVLLSTHMQEYDVKVWSNGYII